MYVTISKRATTFSLEPRVYINTIMSQFLFLTEHNSTYS